MKKWTDKRDEFFKVGTSICIIMLVISNHQDRMKCLELQRQLMQVEQLLVEYEQANDYMWERMAEVFQANNKPHSGNPASIKVLDFSDNSDRIGDWQFCRW